MNIYSCGQVQFVDTPGDQPPPDKNDFQVMWPVPDEKNFLDCEPLRRVSVEMWLGGRCVCAVWYSDNCQGTSIIPMIGEKGLYSVSGGHSYRCWVKG